MCATMGYFDIIVNIPVVTITIVVDGGPRIRQAIFEVFVEEHFTVVYMVAFLVTCPAKFGSATRDFGL